MLQINAVPLQHQKHEIKYQKKFKNISSKKTSSFFHNSVQVHRPLQLLYKALSCAAFVEDNYTRSEYRQHLLIFTQAIKRWPRNPRHYTKTSTHPTLTSYLSKIKLCSDYYFKSKRWRRAASAGGRPPPLCSAQRCGR